MSIYKCAQCDDLKDQDIEQTYSNDTGSYCERCTDNMSDEEFKQQFPDEILQMKLGLSVSIDVTKIDKARIIEGKKGKYLDLTTFVDLEKQDQYGNNGFISQSTTKEERESDVQTPILGNVKVFYKGDGQQQGQAAPPQAGPQTDFDDDIPF